MAVASDIIRSPLGSDPRNLLPAVNNAVIPLESVDNTNALTITDEIKDLELFIDDMCNQNDMRAIQLYDNMSLELKAEVSFLRKLNQATLLQDTSKNQTKNAMMRDEVMQLRRQL